MHDQVKPKYVIDSILGGTASFDSVVGDGASKDTTVHGRVWPEIPLEHQPPSPQIENAVKEGMYAIYFNWFKLTFDS